MSKKAEAQPAAVSPLFDEDKPLTCLLIADILGLFLKCNPAVSFVILPDFRIKELCQYAACLPGKKRRIQEENMFEAIGSFYCLCMYYGGTIVYGNFDIALHAISIIQTVLSECLISFEWIGETSLVFTDDRVNNMEFIFHNMKRQQFEVFAAANDLLKDIIRDIIKQVRTCRDSKQDIEAAKRKEAEKGEMPGHPAVDCLLIHSIYLFATYALGHMAGVVYSENPVVRNIIPGLYEAMLCVFHVDVEREGKRLRRFERLKRNKNIRDPDRFAICLQMAKCMSFVSMKNCNVNYIQQIRMVRGRLSRGKPTSEVDFAQLKATSIESSLFRQEKASKSDLTDEEKAAIALPVRDRINLVRELFVYHFQHRQVPAAMYVEKVGKEVPESLVSALEDSRKDKDKSSRSLAPSQASSQPGVGGDDDDDDESGLTGEYKDMDEICHLPCFMRFYYLLTRSIREYYAGGPHYFNLTDKNNKKFAPTKRGKKGSQTSISTPEFETSEMVIDNLENAYYESAQRPWPRFLDQREGLYWVCDSIIERIFHEVKGGNMFVHVNEPYIGALQSRMKKEVAAIKRIRMSGTQEIEVLQQSGTTRLSSTRSRGAFAQESGPGPGSPFGSPPSTSASGGERGAAAIELCDKSHSKNHSAITTPIKTKTIPVKSKTAPTKTKSIPKKNVGDITTPIKKTSNAKETDVNMQSPKFGTNTAPLKTNKIKKLDLMERLSLARKEAVLERKLENLRVDGELQSSVLQRERFQALEKKFQPLDKNDASSDSITAAASVMDLPHLNFSSHPSSDGGALRKKGQKSIVWVPPPEAEDEMERRKKLQAYLAEKAMREETARTFTIPSGLEAQGKEYIQKIKKSQEEAKKKAKEEFQERGDMHDIEMAFVKQLAVQKLAEKRALIRNDVNESLNIKKRAEKQKKEMKKKEKYAKKAEKKLLEEQNYAEVERIKNHKKWQEAARQREEAEWEERRQLEAIRLQNMSDIQEYNEVLRRIEEEERMRYLEGIQRKKEDKRFAIERAKAMELLEKQQKVQLEKQKILNDIRKSHFLYHNGKLGYYRGIRDEPLPFVQYEDDWGNPYYLDPLTNTTVYDVPDGVSVVHYTEKEAVEYDLLYGEGAYAALQAERAWKMQCNIDKGYVGEDGEWIPLNGYYDEDYEFVQQF